MGKKTLTVRSVGILPMRTQSEPSYQTCRARPAVFDLTAEDSDCEQEDYDHFGVNDARKEDYDPFDANKASSKLSSQNSDESILVAAAREAAATSVVATADAQADATATSA